MGECEEVEDIPSTRNLQLGWEDEIPKKIINHANYENCQRRGIDSYSCRRGRNNGRLPRSGKD